jgi:sortase A
MRLVVARDPTRRILLWTQRTLFAAAFAMLTYCGLVLTDAWIFQRRAANELVRHQLQQDEEAALLTASYAPPPASTDSVVAIEPDGLIGRIEIARLDLSVIVVEGIGAKALRRAVGHIPRTGMPGQHGNVGIAGHRDTFFRPLRDIVPDDIITLTTLSGVYRYRVVSTRVVAPTEVSVLDPSEDEVLTLVTCYPFYFVGAAPDRFIVRAARVV